MEVRCYDELQSFLSKLTFLSGHGVNATLNINSFLGNIYVNLSADLGHIHSLVVPRKEEETRSTPHVKPSRVRRRKRRQRERAIAKEMIDAHVDRVVNGDTCDEVESAMEDGQNLIDDSRSLTDQTPTMTLAKSSHSSIQPYNATKPTTANIDLKCWDQLSMMSKRMSSPIENCFSLASSSSISGTLNGIKPSHGPALKPTSFQHYGFDMI